MFFYSQCIPVYWQKTSFVVSFMVFVDVVRKLASFQCAEVIRLLSEIIFDVHDVVGGQSWVLTRLRTLVYTHDVSRAGN